MRALIWWLRSCFCTHDLKVIAEYERLKAWPPSMRGDLIGSFTVKECRKCGWRWTQRIP